jgi:photosystem II stability/assembly factor-like uncharacterized protein
MRIIKIVLGLLLLGQQSVAQNPIKILTEKKGISLRGLSVPSEKVVWASGSKGTVVKSVNGGESFEWLQVKGFETRDFRAIHAWDDKEVLIVAIAAPAVILKTMDGGISWNKVYENADTSMFLDAVKFKDNFKGTVIGDPINDTIFLLNTEDRGNHWNKVKPSFWKSNVFEGEAFFASSNSNLTYFNNKIIFISGGMKSRLWIGGNAMPLLMMEGGKSTGANSIDISPDQHKMIVVGGDFMKDTVTFDVARAFNKNGNQFQVNTAFTMPNGYRSSVKFIDNNLVVACGTSGVDMTNDAGKKWTLFSTQSFHVVQHQPNKKAAFFAGSGGRIGYYRFE